MRDGPQQQVVFPRMGRGVKALLIAYLVLGILDAILYSYVPGAWKTFFSWLALVPTEFVHHPWTLLTAGLLTDPQGYSHLIFTLVGFYFLGPAVESKWGTARFLRLVAISIATGFALVMLFHAVVPIESKHFHPGVAFGPSAALAALAVAWGRENANAQMRLYFILPISGRVLVWITLGFCVLGVFFPASVTEGVVAPFGGFIAGLLLAGSPSPIRALYLRAKLGVLRRRGERVALDIDKPKKRRTGGPPLRVVAGGLDDLEKRPPPKDKRYLN
ncbi:MAG TPA: rhomboid family intramembrane serine protease [Polyangiaceae bacterium]|jgi:membrane associated rhomboid family serine protease|nr:rhomboid family intramembrane serine protease [Polyangiaceae bacterium]